MHAKLFCILDFFYFRFCSRKNELRTFFESVSRQYYCNCIESIFTKQKTITDSGANCGQNQKNDGWLSFSKIFFKVQNRPKKAGGVYNVKFLLISLFSEAFWYRKLDQSVWVTRTISLDLRRRSQNQFVSTILYIHFQVFAMSRCLGKLKSMKT